MKTICAWCKKLIKEDVRTPDGPISHGLCPSCAEKLYEKFGTPLEQFLDQWHLPIVLLNTEGQVLGGNSAARSLPGFHATSKTPLLPGDVFECPWADLPEGCGKTVHCCGCAIRRAISHTQKTGQSIKRLPGHLDSCIVEEPASIWISTEKAGDLIFLLIEKTPPA